MPRIGRRGRGRAVTGLGMRRLRVGAGLATTTLAAGTVGYMLIEGWPLADAFFMTVITVSTVGFSEVHPLSEPGRIFTAGLVLGGIATIGFAAGAVGEWLIAGERPARVARRVRRMRDHVIVCGYGRVAQAVVESLLERDQEFCVIERSGDVCVGLRDRGVSAIQGDATMEAVLQDAGIGHAETVVALLPSDPDNLSVTMTANALRPGVRIIARSEEQRSRANLERAGAKKQDVISPYNAAAARVLHCLFSPGLDRFYQGITAMTQSGRNVGSVLRVPADHPFAGRTLAEADFGDDRHRLVVAVLRRGKLRFAPSADFRVEEGDELYLLGESEEIPGA